MVIWELDGFVEVVFQYFADSASECHSYGTPRIRIGHDFNMELTDQSGCAPSLRCSILRGVSNRLIGLRRLIGAQQFHHSQYSGPDEILKLHYMAFCEFVERNVSSFRHITTERSYTKCTDFLLIGSNTESLHDKKKPDVSRQNSVKALKWPWKISNLRDTTFFPKRRDSTIQRHVVNISEEGNPVLYRCEHLKTHLKHASLTFRNLASHI